MNSEAITVKNKNHPCGEYGDSQDFKRRRLCPPLEDFSVIASDCFNIICSHLCGDEALALMLSNRRFHVLVVGYFCEKMWSPVWEMLAFVKNTLKVNGMDSEVDSINSMQFDSNQNSIPEIDRACLKVMETVVSIVNFSEQNIGKNDSTLEVLFSCYIKDHHELIISKSLKSSIKSLVSILHLQIFEINIVNRVRKIGRVYGLQFIQGLHHGLGHPQTSASTLDQPKEAKAEVEGARIGPAYDQALIQSCFSETPVSLKLKLANKFFGSEMKIMREWELDYETNRNPCLEFSSLFAKTFDVDYVTLFERTKFLTGMPQQGKSKFRDYDRHTKMSWEKDFMLSQFKIKDITEEEELRFDELFWLGYKLNIQESSQSCLTAFSLAKDWRESQEVNFDLISECLRQLMENGFYNEAIDFCFKILSTYKAFYRISSTIAERKILQIAEEKIAKGQIGFAYAIWKKLHAFSCHEIQRKIFLAIAASSLELFLDSNDDIESATLSAFSTLRDYKSVGLMNLLNYLFVNKRSSFESFVNANRFVEYKLLIEELINHRLFDLALFFLPYMPQTNAKDLLLRRLIPSFIQKGDLTGANKYLDGIVGGERKFAEMVFSHQSAKGVKK